MKNYDYMDNTDRIVIGIFFVLVCVLMLILNLRIDRLETNTADSDSGSTQLNLLDEGADAVNDPPADPLPPLSVTEVEQSSRVQETGGEIDIHDIELHNATLHYRITCYGPPTFTADSVTASGLTVGNAIAKAKSLGLDGIVAVSPDTPWYDDAPKAEVGVYVGGVSAPGFYLVADRTARWVRGVVDIYNPNISSEGMWNERRVECYEIDRGNQ